MIRDFFLPGAHRKIFLLLFIDFKVREILKKSFLLTNLTFLLFFLLILFLNNEAICPSLPIPKRTKSNLELLPEKYF